MTIQAKDDYPLLDIALVSLGLNDQYNYKKHV